MPDLALIVDRASRACEAAVHDAIRDADCESDASAAVALGLLSRLAGLCLHEIIGVPGRADLSDLLAADPDEVLWALEAIANLRLEEIAERTNASLMLPRRLS